MSTDETEMVCDELVELVTEYFEGTLPEPDRVRFETHLAECPWCVTYVEQLRQTARALGGLSQESVSPEAQSRLLEVFDGWKAGR